MRRSLPLLSASLLLVGGLAWLALESDREPPPDPHVSENERPLLADGDVSVTLGEERARREAADDEEARDAEGVPAEAPAEEAVVPTSGTWEVRGIVLEATGVPLPAVDVRVLAHDPRGVRVAEARTGDGGEFTLQLERDAWAPGRIVDVRVTREERETLLDRVTPLADGMELRVPAEVALRGRLVAEPALPFALSELWVAARGELAYYGQTALDAEGRFAIPCRPERPERTVGLVFGRREQDCVFPVAVAWAALTSPAGAEITWPVATLSVVIEGDGRPLEEALAAVKDVASDPNDPAWIHLATDAEGRATVRVAPGTYDVLASAAEFDIGSARVVLAAGDDVERRFALTAVGETERVTGEARGPGGAPIADAVLTAWPPGELQNLGTDAYRQTRSGPDGTFELVVPRQPGWTLYGFHRELGSAPVQALEVGTRHVVVAFEGVGAALIEVATSDSHPGEDLGAIELRLLDARGALADRARSATATLALEELSPGAYRAELFAARGRLAADVAFEVQRGETTQVSALLRPGRGVGGRVVDAAGRAVPYVAVDVRVDGWTLWSDVADEDGRFRVPVGVHERVTVVARDGAREAPCEAAPGDEVRIELP